MKKIFFLLIISFILLTFSNTKYDDVNEIIANMTLREKVGQLFVVKPDVLNSDLSIFEINNPHSKGVTDLSIEMEDYYKKYPVGGFIIFDKNLVNSKQITDFNSKLHNINKIKPLIYIDEEGGSIARIANNSNFNVIKTGTMYSIGKTKKTDNAYKAGLIIGQYLKNLGFDVDFAPVADVLDKDKRSAIGNRSFGQEPELVADMAVSIKNGLEEKNILSCFKHYPGHGACVQDTHNSFAYVNKTWKELLNSDLIPFIEGIKNDVPYIMVAHINYPNVKNEDLPASLSEYLITDKLRKELKFNGIIITDGMAMGAIQKKYSDDDSSVLAIKAGVDIILLPFSFENAFESVIRAVQKGIISEERINESVYRVLSLKKKYFNEN